MNYEELKNFEEVYNYKFPKRHAIMVRVDGKNFSKATAVLNKPFDKLFSGVMEETMEQVANSLDGCCAAYTQSDEISFLIINKDREAPIFGNRIQKIVSITSSTTTLLFYKNMLNLVLEYQDYINNNQVNPDEIEAINERITKLYEFLSNQLVFDGRAFLIPENEAMEAFEVRQNNCITNSINSMGSYYLETTENKSRTQIRTELFDAGHSWDDMPNEFKYGIMITKAPEDSEEKWIRSSERLINGKEEL